MQAQPNFTSTQDVLPAVGARTIEEQNLLLWMVKDLLATAPKSLDEIENPKPAVEFHRTFDEVREQIIHAFGVETFKANGFSTRNVSCIFHDDKHPSATLHREKGLWCFVCGKTFTWKELAEELGITWNVQDIEPLITGEFVGMSRAARRAFISAGFTNLARGLDVLIDREKTGEYFTFRELKDVLSDVLSEQCIRDVFDHLQGKRLPQKPGNEFLREIFLSYSFQLKEGKKSPKNSKRGRLEGRPQATVRIPTQEEITRAANVSPDVHYSMTAKVIGNAAEYRAACMADEIRRKPGKYARKQLTAPLGISAPTIKAYCERAGIQRTPQPVKLTELKPDEVLTLPENFLDLRVAIMTKKVKSNVFLQDERGIRYQYTKAGAMRAADMGGGKLYRAEYQASDYRMIENQLEAQ